MQWHYEDDAQWLGPIPEADLGLLLAADRRP
jgi:hypothetical protein